MNDAQCFWFWFGFPLIDTKRTKRKTLSLRSTCVCRHCITFHVYILDLIYGDCLCSKWVKCILLPFHLACIVTSGVYSNCWMLIWMNRRFGMFVKKLLDTTFIICFRHIKKPNAIGVFFLLILYSLILSYSLKLWISYIYIAGKYFFL